MPVEVISGVPPWVLVGTALGGVASALVALVFYVGNRLSPPTSTHTSGHTRSGDARRSREIREYLSEIGERVRENHPVGGIVVPFYLPERGVAITFDAHDYFRLEGAGVFAVLCEHEMPGRGLGRRLPFEVADPDRGSARSSRARPSPDPVSDAFGVLGLRTDAEVDEVRRAYRERVKTVHPDQGGDEASFRRVREAYATARAHAEGDARRSGRVTPDGQDGRTGRTGRGGRAGRSGRGGRTGRSGRGGRTGRSGRGGRTGRSGRGGRPRRTPGFGR